MSAVKNYDLVVVGGGLAGAALGRSMALAGSSVLIVEKSIEFRDRIRGEVLLPWGGVEAMELGIHGLLLKTCGQELPREYFIRGGVERPPREFQTTAPRGNGIVSFFHPEMQEVLLSEAERSGCEVWRGANISAVGLDGRPRAKIETDNGQRDVEARLIVGADGRASYVATLLGFKRERDPPHLFSGGFQLKGNVPTDLALYFYQNGATGRGAILVSNKPGNYRGYVLHHAIALKRRWSGERDYAAAQAHFIEVGAPRDWIEALTPHGVHATFDGAHRWITQPVLNGCVLIGEAAGSSDPVWGCGLSRTLRDVRLLRDRLLTDTNWLSTCVAFAVDQYVRTTFSDKATLCPLDHVNRQFHPSAPNRLWVSDFTYVSTWSGMVYVAFVIDGSVGDSYDNALAVTIIGLYKGRSDPQAGTLAILRSRRVRNTGMGRLVQSQALARTHRQHPPAEAEASYSAATAAMDNLPMAA